MSKVRVVKLQREAIMCVAERHVDSLAICDHHVAFFDYQALRIHDLGTTVGWPVFRLAHEFRVVNGHGNHCLIPVDHGWCDKQAAPHRFVQ